MNDDEIKRMCEMIADMAVILDKTVFEVLDRVTWMMSVKDANYLYRHFRKQETK